MSADVDQSIENMRKKAIELPEGRYRESFLDMLDELETLLEREAEDRYYQYLADGAHDDYLRDLKED